MKKQRFSWRRGDLRSNFLWKGHRQSEHGKLPGEVPARAAAATRVATATLVAVAALAGQGCASQIRSRNQRTPLEGFSLFSSPRAFRTHLGIFLGLVFASLGLIFLIIFRILLEIIEPILEHLRIYFWNVGTHFCTPLGHLALAIVRHLSKGFSLFSPLIAFRTHSGNARTRFSIYLGFILKILGLVLEHSRIHYGNSLAHFGHFRM